MKTQNTTTKKLIEAITKDVMENLLPLYKAAPALLKACEKAISMFEQIYGCCNDHDELDAKGEQCQICSEWDFIKAAITAAKGDTELPKVVISVQGGLIEHIEKPDDVVVSVRDYDIEGFEEDRIGKDEQGHDCLITEY